MCTFWRADDYVFFSAFLLVLSWRRNHVLFDILLERRKIPVEVEVSLVDARDLLTAIF
jgi:hypothetical protein